ncbi:phosphoglucosamine mutase [Actinomyces sp. Chiba101]|uniref:Phosphoglucosamine mutase n=1 Tax=Actinomyces denticolens TaxID=52767 RepID=A0ABY1I1S9_9ACTO|nr:MULTISPECIES: phosphoglucosamine mutase [Actinomyces]BAW92496.1 phosphoglucosamine mutase [Actinomyces sp. Chiba101]GAV94553.1 phosphoglucosamine mutase GlmM [Actinomyces denticolens]SHI46117.1 phosphoglucosamine mutase [Actinomyces denticolens]SUU08732.1 Phosphoglucosamine mutase [Actinomyces denticolens]
MARLFGTDGVRGLANDLLTPALAVQLGEAAARVLTKEARARSGGARPRAIVGRDTRASGEFLDHAISSGLASSGVDVTRVGVLPTPAIAHLTATQDIDLGVMISASHNPFPDNGIKFFARGGYKLEDAVEDEIEALLGGVENRPTGAEVGRVIKGETVADQNYINHLVDSVATDLSGLRIVVDASNGAASAVGPAALRAAGAEVIVINASPDGLNINADCGSTHPEQLQRYVPSVGADMGVAYDGDADRCLAVDADGNLVDGDQIMGLLALGMKADGTLGSDTLVVTVMSNLGLILAMRDHGIRTVQTGVGDRYVLEKMLAGGYTLGGEQSGHVIDTVHATTGDGVLTSLHIAARVKRSGKSLAELASIVTRLPQTLINVKGVDKASAGTDQGVQDAVAAAEAELGETGRVLLRPSGTEPLVRVMVEAATQERADAVAGRLAGVVKERLAL